ncbi:MAG: phosphoenolpyruvate--protein phosphotransferase, partial [Pseudomonadota bacterium]
TGELHEILIAMAEIATDPAIAEEAAAFIAGGRTASFAMVKATEVFQELLTASGGYLAERVSDVANIRDRVLCEIVGTSYPEIPHFDLPTVLIAQDLSPADTADLETDKVLAIITAGGGPTSHTAIIARSNGIPAIVACPGVIQAALASPNATVAVDATTGQTPRQLPIRQNLSVAAFSHEIGVTLAATVLQTDANTDGLQRNWPEITTGIEKHWGYAFQWFALAVVQLLLYFWYQWIKPYRHAR